MTNMTDIENATHTQLVQSCERLRDELEWLYSHDGEEWEDIDEEDREGVDREEMCSEDGEYVSLIGYLDENALEIVDHGTRTQGEEWEFHHVVIVFGTGGPHIEVTTEHGGCVRGYWGSDRVDRSIGGDVGRWLDEIRESY